MRPTVIVFALLAVLLAGVAAYLVNLYLQQQAQPVATSTEPTAPVGVTKILVAARNVNPGEVLTEVDIRWVDWPQALLEDRYIQESEFGADGRSALHRHRSIVHGWLGRRRPATGDGTRRRSADAGWSAR
jgi:Flp pilus assembly protein CpaB